MKDSSAYWAEPQHCFEAQKIASTYYGYSDFEKVNYF